MSHRPQSIPPQLHSERCLDGEREAKADVDAGHEREREVGGRLRLVGDSVEEGRGVRVGEGGEVGAEHVVARLPEEGDGVRPHAHAPDGRLRDVEEVWEEVDEVK